MVNIQLRVLLLLLLVPWAVRLSRQQEVVAKVVGNVIFYPLENGNHKIPLTHTERGSPSSRRTISASYSPSLFPRSNKGERERERKQILNHHDGNPLFKKAPFATQKMNNKSSWSHERRGEKPLGLLDQQQRNKQNLIYSMLQHPNILLFHWTYVRIEIVHSWEKSASNSMM